MTNRHKGVFNKLKLNGLKVALIFATFTLKRNAAQSHPGLPMRELTVGLSKFSGELAIIR